MKEGLDRDVVSLILQYLSENNIKDTLHKLETESGLFFNIGYFEKLVQEGNWSQAEKYLSSFTKIDENRQSQKIYFEMRKQKYLEALAGKQFNQASDVLVKEIHICADIDDYKELRSLFLKDNFRRHKSYANYTNSKTERAKLIQRLKKLLRTNPSLVEKLTYPEIEYGKLQSVISQNKFHLRGLELPKGTEIKKILRLAYMKNGASILALAGNGIHLLWKWPKMATNLDGMPTTKLESQLWSPSHGVFIKNDTPDHIDLEEEMPLPCFSISNNDDHVLSTSGKEVSLFVLKTFKKCLDCMIPPAVATYLAFYPQDNNVFVIGMNDSEILIYDSKQYKIKFKRSGHTARITGMTFSKAQNLLVSSSANAQIIVWETRKWERRNSCFLQIPGQPVGAHLCETHVQFHEDEKQFLAVHETQLAMYESTNLARLKQWLVPEPALMIRHATFSCDSQLVYCCFVDGSMAVFGASTLQPQSWLNLSDFVPMTMSSPNIEPTVIAASPKKQKQFAVGFSDGRVYIFEPTDQSQPNEPFCLCGPRRKGVHQEDCT